MYAIPMHFFIHVNFQRISKENQSSFITPVAEASKDCWAPGQCLVAGTLYE